MTTIRVTWIEADGRSTTKAVPVGHTLMEVAQHHGIAGIAGECGGALACATCHVVVASAPGPLDAVGPVEDDMLDMVEPEREAHSRLSCQIVATEALDGLVLKIP